ncbi:MAG: hypothetical protein ABEH88_02830 [Halobacteriales archaeon]
MSVGIYEPNLGGSGATEGAHERAIHLFTRALRVVSRWIPGRPRQDTRTIIVPLLVVGVPVIMIALLVLWAVPITVFGHVLANTPGPWSTVLAFLSLFAYFGAAIVSWRVEKNVSRAVGTAAE